MIKSITTILIINIALLGCGSKRDSSINKYNGSFHSLVNTACNIRNKDEKYCQCFSSIVAKNTPKETQQDILYGMTSSSNELSRIMLSQMKNIEKHCERTPITDLKIPQYDVTPLLSNILSSNKGNLLTPNNINKLKPLTMPIGWKFKLLPQGLTQLEHGVFVYKQNNNNEYYFDYSNFNPTVVTANYKWSNGYRYFLQKNVKPMVYTIGSDEPCKFKLGMCEYTSYNGSKKYIYTEFKDGMWLRNSPGSRQSRSLRIDVYDTSGFPLYSMLKSMRNGKHIEKTRVEELN